MKKTTRLKQFVSAVLAGVMMFSILLPVQATNKV